VKLPDTYVVHKFYQHAGYPRYKRANSTYEGGCPTCREGKSWGRKRRLYYIPAKDVVCCHNCGWYGSTIKWILHIENITYEELMNQVNRDEYQIIDIMAPVKNNIPAVNIQSLPHDSINLFNDNQVNYYKTNQMVLKAVDYIRSRRLNTACNRPDALYLSLTDKIHKNRLCIPTHNRQSKVIHYQTRRLLSDDTPKYLSKINSDKGIFGLNLVTDLHHTIYILEGPLDSFFIENGIAIAGIQENSNESLTTNQQSMLQEFCFLKKTWVLDNQRNDQASMLKSRKLAAQNHNIFIWPSELSRFKDINEMCMFYKLDCISTTFIDKNTFTGTQALLKLS
jgi:hypothetical protein